MPRKSAKEMMFASAAQAASSMASAAPKMVSARPSDDHLCLAFVAGEALGAVHKYVCAVTIGAELGWPPDVQAKRTREALDQAVHHAAELLATLRRIPLP